MLNSDLNINVGLSLPVKFFLSFAFSESLNGGFVSGACMVTSYLLNNEGPSLFSTSQSIMSIQTHPPVFDVIHQYIATIMLYTNSMTFWENARTFPK